MEKNHNAVFGPGDELYGLDSEKFEFSSSSELLEAVASPKHPLSKHADWIRDRIQNVSVKSKGVIRVDCVVNPPVVEIVSPSSIIPIVGLAALATFLLGVVIVI